MPLPSEPPTVAGNASRIRKLIEARGYQIVHSGSTIEARVEDRVVARVIRFLDLEEGLRALAGELGIPVGDPVRS